MLSKQRILLGADNNALVWLIGIQAVSFILFSGLKIVYYLSGIPMEFFQSQIQNWFVLSANSEVFFSRPWTILTHLIYHDSFFGLLSNMLWLWAFGFILQDLSGNSKLIPIFLYGGVLGAIVFILTANVFPVFAPVVANGYLAGAGSGLMAVVVATTTLTPEYRIFPMLNGGIPLWVLTLIFVALDFSLVASGNGCIALAHLSAAIIGMVFIKQLQRGNDWGVWMENLVNWVDGWFNPEKKALPTQTKSFYSDTRKSFTKTPTVSQQRVDALLDKINEKGYHFLTEEEKDFLKKASQHDL